MESARWNFDATDAGIVVCRDHHDKGDKCDFEQMHPAEVLQLLNTYRARIIELERLAALMLANTERSGAERPTGAASSVAPNQERHDE